MKPWVRIGVRLPEAVHVLLGRVVVLVVAGHENDRRDAEFPADERHPPLPGAVGDVAGQDKQVAVPVRIELIDRLRQVPLPVLKMQVGCNLDFHHLYARA